MSPQRTARQSMRVALHRGITEQLRRLVYQQQVLWLVLAIARPVPPGWEPSQVGSAILLASTLELRWRRSVLGCIALVSIWLGLVITATSAVCFSRLIRLGAAPRLSPEDRAALVEPLRLSDLAVLLTCAFAFLRAAAGA